MKALRLPLLLLALPAVLLAFAPARHGWFLLERTAVGSGEIWRLWTGHWVHFSMSHVTWNLAVLLGAGGWLEHLRPGWLLRYTLIAAPLISLALLLGEPAMHSYGGLSGLATSVVVLLALTQLGRRDRDCAWWGSLLVLVVGKIAFDATQTEPLFVGFGAQTVRASALAHAAGAVAALALFLARPTRRHELHKQVFSTAPIGHVLATLEARLPALQREAGVSRLVSQWDEAALAAVPVADRVDVTALLLREFQVPASHLKQLEQLRSAKPLPLERARLMSRLNQL